jgi:hypothetical protein
MMEDGDEGGMGLREGGGVRMRNEMRKNED